MTAFLERISPVFVNLDLLAKTEPTNLINRDVVIWVSAAAEMFSVCFGDVACKENVWCLALK